MKKIFTFLVVLFSTLSVFAADFKSGDLWYTITGTNTVEVAKHSDHKSLTDVEIPEAVVYGEREYSVVRIGSFAFQVCSVTSVAIPNSVTSIAQQAFDGCSGLTFVALGNSVKSIGTHAFRGCSSLTSITLGNSVKSIETNAFDGCSSLTSVTLGNSVTSIGNYAFAECSSLASVVISEGVKSVGDHAFWGCPLTEVTVKAAAPPILSAAAFSSSPICNIPCGTLAAYEASDWAAYADSFVEQCSGDAGSGDTSGSGDAGSDDTSGSGDAGSDDSGNAGGNGGAVVASVITYTSTDGNVVTPNDPTAFGGANIISNTYADGVGTITFDAPLTEIGSNAFVECHKLTSIVLPAGVKDLGDNVFETCDGLVSVVLPDGLQTIGRNAFASCESLISVVLPSSVTSVGIYAFNGCSALKSAVLSEKMTVIDQYLFNGCEELGYVVIPSGVKEIKRNAFYGCAVLDSIKCLGTTPAKLANKSNVFYGLPVSAKVYVPCVDGKACVSYVDEYEDAVYNWVSYFKGRIQESPAEFDVTYSANYAERGSVTLVSNTECGAYLKATPKTHYQFKEWSDGTTNADYKLILDKDTNLIAIFEPVEYTVTVYSADTITHTVAYKDSVEITANEKCGWRFDKWEEDGNTEKTRKVEVLNNDTLTAVFKPAIYTVQIKANVCDGGVYTDTIIGIDHLISSADPSTCKWNDTVCAPTAAMDTVFAYTITPMRAPKMLDKIDVGRISAEPGLTQGLKPDTAASVKAIKDYYQSVDNDSVADVQNVYWTFGDSVVACGADKYSMTLYVKHECDATPLSAVLTFPVDTTIVRDTLVAEACESYKWAQNDSVYTKSGKYVHVDTTAAGCDSAYYLLDLTIWGVDTIDTVYNVCPGTIWLGETLLNKDTTLISESKNEHGCKTINITKYHVYEAIPVTRVDTSICYGDTLEWLGEKYWYDVDRKDTLKSQYGCDSVVQLVLNVWDSVPVTIEKFTICEGQSYIWPVNDVLYTESKIDSVVLADVHGCDSVVKLDLTVMPKLPVDTLYDTICHGMTYEWELADTLKFTISGNDFDQVMTKEVTMKTTCNCDSTVVLHLTELPAIPETTVVDTICYGEKYLFDGVWYKESLVDTFALTSKLTGCDSIVYFHLTVLDSIPLTVVDSSICYGSSIIWFDDTLSINVDGRRDTVKTIHGCDSIIELKLTILPEVKPKEINDTVCFGESYFWDITNRDYPAGTTYADTTVLNGQNCDSLIILHLHVLDSIAPVTHVYDTICNGDPYTWTLSADSVLVLDGTTFDGNKEVTRTLQTAYGCDSTVTLHLTELAAIPETTVVDTICFGEKYLFDGVWYKESLVDTFTLTSKLTGCDSIVYLNLHVLDSIPVTVVDSSICYGSSIIWFDDTLSINIDGRRDTVKTIHGCDSIVELNLTILPEVKPTEIYDTVCFGESYYWDVTNRYYPAGTRDADTTVLNGQNCDSLIILHLHVLDSIAPVTHVYDTICNGDPYTWTLSADSVLVLDGTTFDGNKEVTRTLQTAYGCDSTVTLHLTELLAIEPAVTYATICEDEMYQWDINGEPYYKSDTVVYTKPNSTGCDSIFVLYLTVLPKREIIELNETICHGDTFTITHDGIDHKFTSTIHNQRFEYKDINGCDSIVNLNLTVLKEVPVDKRKVTTCFGVPYRWDVNDVTYPAKDTTVTVTKTNTNGCDSLIVLELTVLPEILMNTIDTTTCFGVPFVWDGDTIPLDVTSPATLIDTLTSSTGCDSVVTLNIRMLPEIPVVTIDTTICYGEKCLFRDSLYSESTELEFNLTSELTGCDSTVYFRLTVLDSIPAKTVSATTCFGVPYEIGDSVIVGSVTNKKIVLESTTGCDSIVYLTLKELNKVDTIRHTAYLCYGDLEYHWVTNKGVRTYTAATIDTVTLKNINGCDSVVIFTLIEMPQIVETVDSTICYGDTIEWNGMKCYETRPYYANDLKSVISGCDSTAILNLTVLPKVEEIIIIDSICPGETYEWYGYTLTGADTVSITELDANGCPAVTTLHLGVRTPDTTYVYETICEGSSLVWDGVPLTETYSDTTTHSNKFGCDSVVIFNLTVNPTIETTEYVTICYHDSITWNDTTYVGSEVGIGGAEVQARLTSAQGCDSIAHLVLTVLPEVPEVEVDYHMCAGETYTLKDIVYATDTVVRDTLKTVEYGCDSVIVYNLHFWPVIDTVVYDTICYGDTLIWVNDTALITSGIYTRTLTSEHGCDSTVTLHLHVLPEVALVPETISACDSREWNGKVYTASGIYRDTLTTVHGCDSIAELHLTIHNSFVTNLSETACDSYTWHTGDVFTKSGIYYDTLSTINGCDSILELTLTVNHSTVGTPEERFICFGDSTVWEGVAYDSTGIYTTTLTNAVGCDSIATLQLTVLSEMVVDSSQVTICPSELPYIWDGDTLKAEGIYYHYEKFVRNTSCDSAEHKLTLVVLPNASSDTTVVACDEYTWNGITYTASGDYTFTTTAANGCDSVATLHLTVNYSNTSDTYMTLCFGDSVTWNGMICDSTKTYVDTLTNAAGCDSIAYLHLTILPDVIVDQDSATVCPSDLPYSWRSYSLTKAGLYYDTLRYTLGCDSIIYEMNLKVLKPDTVILTDTICDSIVWNGQTCAASGRYEYTTKGSDGCDSLTFLDLTVTHTKYESETVVACDEYTWNGKTYTTSGEYTFTTTAANGCDSVTTLYLTVNYSTVGDPEERFICYGDTTEWEGKKYFKTDRYTTTLTNAAGCDSTAYLQLTVLDKMVTEYENIYACPSECPYKWNDQYLTASGTYYYYEQFVDNEDCDSVEHVLTFTVYDMSLPTTVTTPISICGKAVYTLDATEEVEAHIASIPTYAPGAKVVWQEWADGVWSDYTYEPLKGSQDSVIMRYVVVSDCGTTASARMTLVVEQPTPENSPELDDLSVKSKYDSRIFLFDLNAFTATFGWTPAPEQVKWFKLVGTMDVYGEGGDDEFVGSGHSYNLPEGDIIAGSYYAIVDQPAIDVDDCDVVYRSVILTGAPSPAAPKLVPNVARPNEMLTIKNLSADQIHEILVFDANGKLITTYKADRVSEFMFNASHTSGYYLVDIINTNGSTTLRYVVK